MQWIWIFFESYFAYNNERPPTRFQSSCAVLHIPHDAFSSRAASICDEKCINATDGSRRRRCFLGWATCKGTGSTGCSQASKTWMVFFIAKAFGENVTAAYSCSVGRRPNQRSQGVHGFLLDARFAKQFHLYVG
jgi:hypothetical protein